MYWCFKWVLNPVLSQDRRCFKGLFMGYKSFYRTSNPIPLHALASLDKKWKEYHYVNKGWRILDIIVSDGRIYVLKSNSQIGIFNLRSCDLRFLELKFAPHIGVYFDKQIRLVASNDQLSVVESPELYRIDLSRMEWVKLYNLGEDQALFRGKDGKMCSKVINPSKWGGQSNCVFSISISSTCVLQL
ncbi:hypothetical protein Patl1_29456 [Pistacia atlantica]|uniref:Uncharacterized protein n=1 Tax=Pistacia atlantica TaxID=434234 RepID=A0ACC1AFZ3_9ROSI|nr:hypothetical protein Patl1_29456 [Pistacia atlantica]